MIGPRINLQDLFDLLDLDLPDLKEVKQKIIVEDWASARDALALHLRTRTVPRWFSDMEIEPEGASEDFVLREADRICKNKFTILDTTYNFKESIDWEFTGNHLKETTWQLARHEFWVVLGKAFLETGNERYVKSFVGQMTDWCERILSPLEGNGKVWNENAEMGSGITNYWRTLECAHRLTYSWPWAFYSFVKSPLFHSAAICTMLCSMMEQVQHLIDFSREDSKWRLKECCGIYCMGVLFPELKDSEKLRLLALDRMMRLFSNLVYPDGALPDLSSSDSSFKPLLSSIDLGIRNGEKFPIDFMAGLQQIFSYRLHVSLPNWIMPALNNGVYTDIFPLIQQAALLFPERQDFQWFAAKEEKGVIPDRQSKAFPYAGQYVMRSSVEGQDSYLLFDAGPIGQNGHEDKLSIIVYSHGQLHIIDPGYYTRDLTSSWQAYARSSQAHNVVIVDGQGQKSPKLQTYNLKKVRADWIMNDDFDFVSASYNEGFGKERINVLHTRSIFFFKSHFWIMTDILEPTDDLNHTYESLFHLNAEYVTKVYRPEGICTCNKTGNNFGIYPITKHTLDLNIVEGQKEPQIQGWEFYDGGAKIRPIPTAIFSLNAKGYVVISYVLMPQENEDKLLVVRELGFSEDAKNCSAGLLEFQSGYAVAFQIQKPSFQDSIKMTVLIVNENERIERIYSNSADVLSFGKKKIRVGSRFKI